MAVERSLWRQRLQALASSQPQLHPYTLALLLEADGYRGINARQVRDVLRAAAPPVTPAEPAR